MTQVRLRLINRDNLPRYLIIEDATEMEVQNLIDLTSINDEFLYEIDNQIEK